MPASLQTLVPLPIAEQDVFFAAAHRATEMLGWHLTYASPQYLEISSAFDDEGDVAGLTVFPAAEAEGIVVRAVAVAGQPDEEKLKNAIATWLKAASRAARQERDEVAEVQALPVPDFSWRQAFIPGNVLRATPLIFWLNVLLFIAMTVAGANILQPASDTLVLWGANYTPATMGGQPWRLLTSVFLHIGIDHLLANMLAFLFIGLVLEPVLGSWRFLLLYLITGGLASITSVWWHDVTLSAGASGAIFGMYGVYLALLTTNLISQLRRKRSLLIFGLFVVYSLAEGLKDHIDNAAHIGGLLSGLLLGWLAYFPIKSKQVKMAKLAGS